VSGRAVEALIDELYTPDDVVAAARRRQFSGRETASQGNSQILVFAVLEAGLRIHIVLQGSGMPKAGALLPVDQMMTNQTMTKEHCRIELKRAYLPPSPQDGARVLVDRLWPRGLRKSEAGIDRWLKDLAPSTELRRWFGHDPARWDEFQRRYKEQLAHQAALLGELRAMAKAGPVTLVFAARDELHNEAVVLRDILSH
jgi:uncharacterized protein YeaO (DUF488 family)